MGNSKITTNRIKLTLDRPLFFRKWTIISYYGTVKGNKNLSYERLSSAPFVSAVGISQNWEDNGKYYTRFFVLAQKKDAEKVLSTLRDYETLKVTSTRLDEFKPKLQEQIILSLAVNAVGQGYSSAMYNNGSLIVCNANNFGESRKRGLICLTISVNNHLCLCAKTTTFSNPQTEAELRKNTGAIFHIGKGISTQGWLNSSLKPIKPAEIESVEELKNYYIKKSQYRFQKTNVSYLETRADKYTESKLFALTGVLNAVNTRFSPTLSVSFESFDRIGLRFVKTRPMIEGALKDFFKDRSISFDDPFKSKFSQDFVKGYKDLFSKLCEGISFGKPSSDCRVVIRLCEEQPDGKDKNENEKVSFYKKYMDRLEYTGEKALQHIVFNGDSEPSESMARRILIELLVKANITQGQISQNLAELSVDWTFCEYKLNKDTFIGARLKVTSSGKIGFEYKGISDFEPSTFAFSEWLPEVDMKKLLEHHEYHVLSKGANTYLIVDTEEVPVLPMANWENFFGRLEKEDGLSKASFKNTSLKGSDDNVSNCEKLLNGYVGLSTWFVDDFEGSGTKVYAYLAGLDPANIHGDNPKGIETAPRVRYIVPLRQSDPEKEQHDVEEITSMLATGFGRLGEVMTYPFPFKFLSEYLDNLCETAYGKHWDEINYKTDL